MVCINTPFHQRDEKEANVLLVLAPIWILLVIISCHKTLLKHKKIKTPCRQAFAFLGEFFPVRTGSGMASGLVQNFLMNQQLEMYHLSPASQPDLNLCKIKNIVISKILNN